MQTMTRPQSIHQDQRYLVLGLGLSGYSAARYLLRHGYDCRVQDDRAAPPYLHKLQDEFPHAEVVLQSLTDDLLVDADCLVVSPGVSIRNPLIRQAAQAGKRVIGDVELFAEAADGPVIAITGSNGKSTVTALLGEMLATGGMQVAVGGNIGVPALDLLDQSAEIYVLELSSFQLETTYNLELLAATVLNVSEDHMDRYDDLEDYRLSKHAIYRHAARTISNADDPLTRHDATDLQFSLQREDADYHLLDGPVPALAVRGEAWLSIDQLKLRGRHNWANCLVAMALAQAAGVEKHAIIDALKSFAGLPHRSQWVADIDSVTWINDSKATNPGATEAAILGLDAPVILLAGGQGKGADMRGLCETLRARVDCVFVFGEDAELITAAWQDCTKVHPVIDLAEAVQQAHAAAQPGQVVLLSPACASFDQFSGFAERGERFAEYVRALQ
jgi:UDP-N-acetylmuramoylalanine--D-glutamate ligase